MKGCVGLGTNNLELAANFYEQLLNEIVRKHKKKYELQQRNPVLHLLKRIVPQKCIVPSAQPSGQRRLSSRQSIADSSSSTLKGSSTWLLMPIL